MKLLMIATALLVLSGCNVETKPDGSLDVKEKQVAEPEFTLEQTSVRLIKVLVDDETGCQYLFSGGDSVSVTPRLNADGTQMCRKAVTQ